MSTLVDLVASAAATYGERTALIRHTGLRDERWSYAGLWTAANAVARWLREQQGVKPGDRVLLCAPNQPRLVASLVGALLARAIPVPLDPFTSGEFAAHVARDSEAALLIAGRPLEVPGLRQIPIAALPVEGKPWDADQRPQPEDIAELVYTSGTTGRPKGVVLTHANIRANVASADRLIPHREPWTMLSLLPLSHMLEQTVGLFAALSRGNTLVYGVAHHPAAIVKALRRYHVVAMVAVPQVLSHILRGLEHEAQRRGAWQLWQWQNRLAAHLPLALRRALWRRVLGEMGGALKVFMCGGAYVPADLERAWERLGVRVVQGYGSTECSPIVLGNTLAHRVPGSAGRPVAGVQVRLAPDGELQVRGASVTTHYWRNDEVMRAAFTPDGWYRSGDLAEVDAKGDFYLKGRLKDMVVLPSGLKVFLEDIEQAVEGQPGVRGCVALDVPLSAGGTGFIAVILGDDPDAAVRAANARLAQHQRVASAVRWDAVDFPRTSLGKIKRAEVRAWLERRAQGQAAAAHAEAAPENPRARLARALSEVSGVDPQKITPQTDLNLDLALSSLARVELALLIEERFGVMLDDGDLAGIEKVGQLAALLESGAVRPPRKEPASWPLRAPARTGREVLQRLLLFPLHALLARPLRVDGVERLHGLPAPALLIANHSSHVDTVSIIRALPRRLRKRLAVAAAADYFYQAPLIGWMASLLLNTFPFSREGAVRASLEHCGLLADEGWSVLIYPEGTRSPTGALLPFKMGIGVLAVGLRAPIVPIAVLGGHGILPKGRVLPRPGPVRVLFGAPMHLPADTAPAEAVGTLQQTVAQLMRTAAEKDTR